MSYRDPSIVGQPLNESEQRAFDLRQANPSMTVEEIAEVIGYAVGSTGNLIRSAETKKGLREPITSGGGGRGRKAAAVVSIKGIADQVMAGYKLAQETVNRLRERMSEADSDAERTPEQLVADETASLTAAVTSAQEALDSFEGLSEDERTAWVESRQKVAQTRREAVRSEVEGNLSKAEAILEEYVTTADQMGIDLSEVEPTDEPDEANSTEATEDEAPEADSTT